MTTTDKSAREKIIRARTNLLVSNGFFGFLAMQLRLKESLTIPTMAVDGVTVYYNPEFTHKLQERECEGVLAHEVMHCCFQHFTRRGNRDPFLWNIAGDYVINNDLLKSGFTLTKDNLNDKKYEGMTTEEVYDRLPQDLKEKFKGGGGKGENGEDVFDPGGCGGVMDAPGDGAAQETTKNTWETAVRTAVMVAAANNAGNIPGSLQRLIDDLKKPKVSWRDLTRRFIDQSMSKDVSWARLNRRCVSTGSLMPGFVSDRMRQAIMCVDTSGSTQPVVKDFVSEVAGALDQGICDTLTVIYADTHVQHVDEFNTGDVVKVNCPMGGGTAFSDTFRWIRENAPDASCIIYLTDLEVADFGEDVGIPTLWAVYNSEQFYSHSAGNVPFGECVHVSNTRN